MFRGVNSLKIDDKGRIAMPKRYHARLEEQSQGQLMVTVHPDDRCLLIYPMPEWDVVERHVAGLPNMDPRNRHLQRLLLGYATESPMDGSGRILLASPLREFVALDKSVMLLGQGGKFELWDEKTWYQHCDDWMNRDRNSQGMSAELGSLTL